MTITTQSEGGLGWITLDRPEVRNALSSELMEAIGLDSTALVVLPAPDYTVSRSFENLQHAKIVLARNLSIRDLFSHTYLLLAKESIEQIEENFSARRRESA